MEPSRNALGWRQRIENCPQKYFRTRNNKKDCAVPTYEQNLPSLRSHIESTYLTKSSWLTSDYNYFYTLYLIIITFIPCFSTSDLDFTYEPPRLNLSYFLAGKCVGKEVCRPIDFLYGWLILAAVLPHIEYISYTLIGALTALFHCITLNMMLFNMAYRTI